MKISTKQALEDLKKEVAGYVASLRKLKNVQHSSTPAVGDRNGQKLPATILVNELITVVKTARAIGMTVELGATTDALTVYLVEKPIPVPYNWHAF